MSQILSDGDLREPDRQHESYIVAGAARQGRTGSSRTTAARCTCRRRWSGRTIGLFGPTDPRFFGPYPLKSPTNYAIQAPVGDPGHCSRRREVFTSSTGSRPRCEGPGRQLARWRLRLAWKGLFPVRDILEPSFQARSSSFMTHRSARARHCPASTSMSTLTPCSRPDGLARPVDRGRGAARQAEGGQHGDGRR